MIYRSVRLAFVLLIVLFVAALGLATIRANKQHTCVCVTRDGECHCPDCGCNLFKKLLHDDGENTLRDGENIITQSAPLTVADLEEHRRKTGL